MANPFKLEVEESLPNFWIENAEGEVFEVGGTSPPITTIRNDQKWGVKLRWTTKGPLNDVLCGTWKIFVYLEQRGGKEFDLPGNTRSVPCAEKEHTYAETLEWEPGKVPNGQFDISATIQLYGPKDVPGSVILSGDGPLLTFYGTKMP